MEWHLVRHGECTWNAEGRLPGATSRSPLTDRGRAQARDAARALAGRLPAGSLLLSSDLVRATQTARILAAVLGLRVETTPLLREQARGGLEGRLTSELVAEPVPDGLDIADVRWGGGESVADVHERLTRFVAGVRSRGAASVVVVSHGDALRVLCAVLDGRGHRDVAWDPWPNGAVVSR